jgi:hypothetical protein
MLRNPILRCNWCGVDNDGHAPWCVHYPLTAHSPRFGVLIFGDAEMRDGKLLARMRRQQERPVMLSGRPAI